MTRRDLAAMRLALCCLRDGRHVIWDALEALRLGDDESCAIAQAVDAAAVAVPGRVLRARLATLLRAMLREVPMGCAYLCVACRARDSLKPLPRNGYRCRACGSWFRATTIVRFPLRFRALWELAPEHRRT